MHRVVAICGAKRSGKDVLANFLLGADYDYEKLKIAEPLKKAVQDMFGFTDKQLEDDEKDVVDAHWGIAPRQALQFLGTDVMQFQISSLLPYIGRRFWINHVLDVIQKNKDKRYVISDLRFHHEYDALIESLGKDNVCIVKIIRPRQDCGSGCCLSKHVSEEEYKSIKEDILLVNDGTEKEMFEKFLFKRNELFRTDYKF